MLDEVLLACLLLALPVRAVWRSRRSRATARALFNRTLNYTKTILIALALMGVLAVDWRTSARDWALLGLAFPAPLPGLIGLGLAVTLLAGLAIALWSGAVPEKAAAGSETALLPKTRGEFLLFLGFSLTIGAAWEILYRGFLLWDLAPRIGTLGAVAAASIAYAAAHGFESRRQFAASLISALIFTAAYALTKSLWWLIIIHASLPIIAATYQATRTKTSEPTTDAIEPGWTKQG